MRKKSAMHSNGQNSGGYSNNKKRYSPGGGSNNGGNNHNRPRKNYGAAREKYLSQARDALASGDRVLAENFFQHAEHCYRMMMEEGHHHRHQHQNQAPVENQPEAANDSQPDVQDDAVGNTSQLPAFLTGTYQGAAQAAAAEQPVQQEWEE